MKLLIAVILLAIVRQEINCQLTDEEEEIVAKFLVSFIAHDKRMKNLDT